MPSTRLLFGLTALASLSQAITITSPGIDTVWDLSQSQTITWTYVSTDPTNVDIYLAHMASQPSINDELFSNIAVSLGSVSVSGLQLPTGHTYQINFVAHDSPDQIYAQSQQFNITGQAVKATSTLNGYIASSTTATGSTLTTSTATGTASTTGSPTSSAATATKSGTATSKNSTTSSSPTASASVVTSKNAGVSTRAGSASMAGVLLIGAAIAALL